MIRMIHGIFFGFGVAALVSVSLSLLAVQILAD